ncbi:hypothetical protein NECAME_02049, partial [Necator americanus]
YSSIPPFKLADVVEFPLFPGVNVRPPDANPHECRFYNAEFSIGSSIISFVIPCILVLFVYIRILVALKKREKAAKMRRLKNLQAGTSSTTRTVSSEDGDEAGRIVTGPGERRVQIFRRTQFPFLVFRSILYHESLFFEHPLFFFSPSTDDVNLFNSSFPHTTIFSPSIHILHIFFPEHRYCVVFFF